jgi:hypothetical protein
MEIRALRPTEVVTGYKRFIEEELKGRVRTGSISG